MTQREELEGMRKTLDEMRQETERMHRQGDDTLQMLCDQRFEQLVADGTIQKRMEERNLDYGDALIMIAEEAYGPLD